ncbi:hypothetical protein F0919_17035 [Taibaiella lutea]|uniref:Uncharacterized protein n=1 Tax=Taibaiella lutea TaxID=2608001 RepID=A0A5M6CH83_9BACT|nr:hypothetical protein [Taibaiella lutea]KAA5532489.1 hypothetical protein F0919_17035 [Taibaiella lutea]
MFHWQCLACYLLLCRQCNLHLLQQALKLRITMQMKNVTGVMEAGVALLVRGLVKFSVARAVVVVQLQIAMELPEPVPVVVVTEAGPAHHVTAQENVLPAMEPALYKVI